jgi:ribonuclease HI
MDSKVEEERLVWTVSRQPVLNRDLWQELDRLLAGHEPHYHWVKGHGVTRENNRCDELAVASTNSKYLLIDEAYEAQNPFPGVGQDGPTRDAGAGTSGP